MPVNRIEMPAKRYGFDHQHDWRVDPNQVLVEVIPGRKRYHLQCAQCPELAYIDSNPGPLPRANDVRTWRKWRWD